MATSGSNTVNTNRAWVKYRIAWSSTPNIAGNYSTVTVQHWLDITSSVNISGGDGNYTIANGEQKWFTKPALNASSGSHLQGTTTHIIYHNSDGTKSFDIKGYINSDYLNYPTMTFSVTLDTIPRTSSFTITDPNIFFNEALAITIARASTAFTHDVTFKFGNYSYKITGATTSASYTIPNSWANAIPNALSAQGTVTVQTKSGSTVIGSTSKQFGLYVPSNMVPSFSSILTTPKPAYFSTYYLQGKSAIDIEIDGAVGIYGSTIKAYSISTTTNFNSTLQKATTPIITTSGTVTITCKITDSRGKIATKQKAITISAYAVPRLSAVVRRVDTGGNYSDSGTRVQVKPTMTITSVGSNAITILRYRYKKSIEDNYNSWINMTNNSFYYFESDVNNDYDVQIEYKDSVNQSLFYNTIIPSSKRVFDVMVGGAGSCMGGAATEAGVHAIKNLKLKPEAGTIGIFEQSSYQSVPYIDKTVSSQGVFSFENIATLENGYYLVIFTLQSRTGLDEIMSLVNNLGMTTRGSMISGGGIQLTYILPVNTAYNLFVNSYHYASQSVTYRLYCQIIKLMPYS